MPPNPIMSINLCLDKKHGPQFYFIYFIFFRKKRRITYITFIGEIDCQLCLLKKKEEEDYSHKKHMPC